MLRRSHIMPHERQLIADMDSIVRYVGETVTLPIKLYSLESAITNNPQRDCTPYPEIPAGFIDQTQLCIGFIHCSENKQKTYLDLAVIHDVEDPSPNLDYLFIERNNRNGDIICRKDGIILGVEPLIILMETALRQKFAPFEDIFYSDPKFHKYLETWLILPGTVTNYDYWSRLKGIKSKRKRKVSVLDLTNPRKF